MYERKKTQKVNKMNVVVVKDFPNKSGRYVNRKVLIRNKVRCQFCKMLYWRRHQCQSLKAEVTLLGSVKERTKGGLIVK